MTNFNEHFPQLVQEDEINLFWLQLLLFPLLWAPLHVRCGEIQMGPRIVV